MSDLLQTIQEQIAKEWFEKKMPHVPRENQKFDLLIPYTQLDLWPEVCKRYAFEVAKASLSEAAINTRHHHPGVDTDSITDPCNIKL